MSYCFKITILAKICIKIRYFYGKIANIALCWGLCPQIPASGENPDPRQPPHLLKISGYTTEKYVLNV